GGLLLARWSSQRDPRSLVGGVPQHKLQTLCAVGLVVYALTITFAAIDWLGSLQPRWYSSIFGLYILISQALTSLALLVILVVGRANLSPGAPVAGFAPPSLETSDFEPRS